MFKGDDMKGLEDMILKYRDSFKLSFDAGWGDTNDMVYHCNALDVIESIGGAAKRYKDSEWDRVAVIAIDDYIASVVEDIKRNDKDIAEEKKSGDTGRYSLFSLYEDHNRQLKTQLERARGAKKKGLNSVLVIGFGDNHGQVCGGDVGMCMDYEGRRIDIDESDFKVITEQNR